MTYDVTGASAADDGAAGAVEAQKAPEKTFTQADLDRIIAGRLAKYSDYDQLKSKAEEAAQAAMSDAEKAVAAARAETRAEVEAEFSGALRLTEARSVATSLGFRDPEDVARYVDLDSIPVKDGVVDAAAITEAAKAVVASRPYLAASAGAAPVSASAVGLGSTPGSAPLTAAQAFSNAFGD